MTFECSSSLIVYAANGDDCNISVLSLNAQSGALVQIQTVALSKSSRPNPSITLAIDPSKRRLFANMRSPPQLQSFEIDVRSGRLMPVADSTLEVPECVYTSLDRSGSFLFGASYEGQQIFVCPIDAEGTTHAIQQCVKMSAGIHSVQPDPSNRFLFYTQTTINRIECRSFSAVTGRIGDTAYGVDLLSNRARHFVFSPDGRHLYLLNEGDGAIDAFDYCVESGNFTHRATVSSMPPGCARRPRAADIHATTNGRFVYSSDRASNMISAFHRDATSGRLTPTGFYPVGDSPRSFAIDPAGQLLVAACQNANELEVFRIDQDSGALQQLSTYESGRNPAWVEIIKIG
jgi:6-phosphogluconolactonase